MITYNSNKQYSIWIKNSTDLCTKYSADLSRMVSGAMQLYFRLRHNHAMADLHQKQQYSDIW